MTCEPIKQLIRNSSDADDDEGEVGENFIKTLSSSQPPPQPQKNPLSRVIKAEVKERFLGFYRADVQRAAFYEQPQRLRNNACLGLTPNLLYYTLMKKALMRSHQRPVNEVINFLFRNRRAPPAGRRGSAERGRQTQEQQCCWFHSDLRRSAVFRPHKEPTSPSDQLRLHSDLFIWKLLSCWFSSAAFCVTQTQHMHFPYSAAFLLLRSL